MSGGRKSVLGDAWQSSVAKIARYGARQPLPPGNAVSSLSVTESVGPERVRIVAPELCFLLFCYLIKVYVGMI